MCNAQGKREIQIREKSMACIADYWFYYSFCILHLAFRHLCLQAHLFLVSFFQSGSTSFAGFPTVPDVIYLFLSNHIDFSVLLFSLDHSLVSIRFICCIIRTLHTNLGRQFNSVCTCTWNWWREWNTKIRTIWILLFFNSCHMQLIVLLCHAHFHGK